MINAAGFDMNNCMIQEKCTLCPRNCNADRMIAGEGYCRTGSQLQISSVCIHKGEEPSISGENGICNVFFTGCNLHCIYCQNHPISQGESGADGRAMQTESLLDTIQEILETGVNSVGFVSPSHMVPQMKTIIEGLNGRGLYPIIVYNTNSYDKHETIRSLEGLIDVYLPDYKYVTPEIASAYSGAYNYPEVALRAIKEMYYQKGSTLRLDENGRAENGLLIRHLVLPGHVEESKKVLRTIADEISPGVHLSLMAQYYPVYLAKNHPVLNRFLYKEEYESVVAEMESLGFRNGWVQDISSNNNYQPDFNREHPFD